MFDFTAYKAAIEARDHEAWLGFFAHDAQWVEYRPENPPRSPNVMSGTDEIRAFLDRIAPVPAELRISHEVLGARRVAYRLTVTFAADGRQIVENVIAELRRLVLTLPLTAGDAIHLASAFVLGAKVRPLVFCSADSSLLRAASAEGLPTWSPLAT